MNGGACTGCLDSIRVAFDRIRKEGFADRMPAAVLLAGNQAKPPGVDHGVLIPVGRCLKKYGDNPHYVPGCPPQMFLITDEFRELVGGQRLFGPKDQYRLACEEEEGD